MPRKVLIISYYFPPSGGAGVQRVLKLVKYLPEFGWQPVVLTVREDADFPARDPSLLDEIPAATPVHRTRIFEPYGLYRKWTGRKKSDAIDIVTNAAAAGGSPAEKISRWVRATFFIPDARRFWKRPALAEAEKIIRSGPVDLILSSAPPYTCHLIGMALRERHRIPWIADFRDSWVGWLSAPTRWSLPDGIDRRMERRVLTAADGLVCVSNGVRNDLMSRNPEISGDKWRLIPNGFDAADFEGMKTGPAEGRFVLTYAGSLYGKRNPAAFIEALESLFSERPEYGQKILFRFVGRLDPRYLDAFRRLGDAFEHIPYVPHRASLEYLLSSSALLLIIDEAAAAASIVTGKIYEYLAARKPVLALAPDGDAADLIRKLNAGKVVSPGDAEGVKTVMKEWVELWLAGRPIPCASAEAVRPFERRAQAGKMAAFFEEIARRTGSAKA
jgi:glycosyltransferase involved in cell wall biosynthesis